MKILHVTNAFPTAEAPVKGVFIKEQIDSLADLADSVDVYVISRERDGRFAYLTAWRHLLRHAGDYDIVHCHHVLVGIVGMLAVPRRKLVLSFMNDGRHNLKGKLAPFGWPVFWLLTAWYRWKIYKSRLPTGVDRNRALLLPNGVDTEVFTPMPRPQAKQALGLDDNKRYLLFVSANSVRREKRIDLFREAIELLQAEGWDIEGLEMTSTPRDQVPLFFNAASVHVLCSDFEGSPNSVREALACGTPVVARGVGGVPALLDGLNVCRVVEGDRAEEIATAIASLLREHDPDSEASRHACRQHLFDKRFTKGDVAEKLYAFYQRMVN